MQKQKEVEFNHTFSVLLLSVLLIEPCTPERIIFITLYTITHMSIMVWYNLYYYIQIWALSEFDFDVMFTIFIMQDTVKSMADNFLQYVMNNHHITREPVPLLQAFQLSLVRIFSCIFFYYVLFPFSYILLYLM